MWPLNGACAQAKTICMQVCVCRMADAKGWGLGGVSTWGHSVRMDKWIAALLWSLSDSNPSQPGLSDEG